MEPDGIIRRFFRVRGINLITLDFGQPLAGATKLSITIVRGNRGKQQELLEPATSALKPLLLMNGKVK